MKKCVSSLPMCGFLKGIHLCIGRIFIVWGSSQVLFQVQALPYSRSQGTDLVDCMTQAPSSFGFRRPKVKSRWTLLLSWAAVWQWTCSTQQHSLTTTVSHLRGASTPLLSALGCFTPLLVSLNHAHGL